VAGKSSAFHLTQRLGPWHSKKVDLLDGTYTQKLQAQPRMGPSLLCEQRPDSHNHLF
jgi:hypothetical protein